VSGTSARRADIPSPGGRDAPAAGARHSRETRAVLENIRDILTSAGASLADVVEVSTFW